jgi:hypothetical protein
MRWWKQWREDVAADRARIKLFQEARWAEQEHRDMLHLEMARCLLGRENLDKGTIYELSQSRSAWSNDFRNAIDVAFGKDQRWLSLDAKTRDDIVYENLKIFFNGSNAPKWDCSADYIGAGKTVSSWMREAQFIQRRVDERLHELNNQPEATQ